MLNDTRNATGIGALLLLRAADRGDHNRQGHMVVLGGRGGGGVL